MGKLKERFHRKNGIVSRIFSMVLALAMIMTMIPAIGDATTAYAASPTIRLYLDKPSTWNTPVVNVWAAGATDGGIRKNQSLHMRKVLDSIM